MINNIRWVIKSKLARSSRPGYPDEDVDVETVAKWVSSAKKLGLKTILCLLSKVQLEFYKDLEDQGGLLGYYRSSGLEVVHIPVEDYKQPPLSDNELKTVDKAYRSSQKPVLVHCSAGIDRTGAVIEHLTAKRKTKTLKDVKPT